MKKERNKPDFTLEEKKLLGDLMLEELNEILLTGYSDVIFKTPNNYRRYPSRFPVYGYATPFSQYLLPESF